MANLGKGDVRVGVWTRITRAFRGDRTNDDCKKDGFMGMAVMTFALHEFAEPRPSRSISALIPCQCRLGRLRVEHGRVCRTRMCSRNAPTHVLMIRSGVLRLHRARTLPRPIASQFRAAARARVCIVYHDQPPTTLPPVTYTIYRNYYVPINIEPTASAERSTGSTSKSEISGDPLPGECTGPTDQSGRPSDPPDPAGSDTAAGAIRN